MFSTNFSKICCSFAQNDFLKIPRWRRPRKGGQDDGHVVK